MFATRNPSKLLLIQKLVSPLELDLLGLNDFPEIPYRPDMGNSLEEIARSKALRAFGSLKSPCIATDTGLSIPCLSEEQQPGVYVRRFSKDRKEQGDVKMLAHYQALFKSFGKEIVGIWTSAIAFAGDSGKTESASFSSQTLFISVASPRQNVGEPLNSLQYNKALNKVFFREEH